MQAPVLLTEIETAHLAGFRRFRDFRRALREGRFPRPDVELPDGPRWSAASSTRWLDGKPAGGSHAGAEETIVERLRRRAEKASPSHDRGP